MVEFIWWFSSVLCATGAKGSFCIVLTFRYTDASTFFLTLHSKLTIRYNIYD